jgi:Uma2 family endonuclease
VATTPVLISVDEYLRTAYRPDCDYVDGEVVERNMGEKPHARLQKFFLRYLEQFEASLKVEALPEQRLQISPTRFRIPDVMLVAVPNADELIVRTPPLLCIEILSSEDRLAKIRERVSEYAGMGVQISLVIDPWRRIAYASNSVGILAETDNVLSVPETPIRIAVGEVFAELDRMEQRSAY